MKLAKISTSHKSKPDDPENHVDTDLKNLFLWSQGRVRIGTGVDGDFGENVEGQFQVFTTSGTPDAENTIAHDLESVPIGYIVVGQDKAGSLYQKSDTGTTWTSTNLYLKCDVASVDFTIFLLK